MFQMLRKIYRKIPNSIRSKLTHFYWYVFVWLKNQVVTCFYMRPPVYLIDNGQFEMAYVGTGFPTRIFWTKLCLGGQFKVRFLGYFWFWEIYFLLKNPSRNCSMCFVETGLLTFGYFNKKKRFSIPKWQQMAININRPLEQIFRSKRNDVQRRIRKNNLEYEVSNDPIEFEKFYFQMLLPYLKSRYSQEIISPDYDVLKKDFNNGALILIKKHGEVIAASLLRYDSKEQIALRVLGIKDGNFEYVQNGAIGAIYYFAAKEAIQRGYQRLYVGGVRPYLSDGLMKFKLSVSAEVVPRGPLHKYCLRMILLKNTPELRKFLIENPFFYATSGTNVSLAFFADSSADLETKAFCDAVNATRNINVDQEHIFSLSGRELHHPQIKTVDARDYFL